MTVTIEHQMSSGRWAMVPQEKVAFYLARVTEDSTHPAHRLPVTTIDEILAALAAGHRLSYRLCDGDFGLSNPAPEWYHEIRLAQPAVPTPTLRYAFTCGRCGEHQDTTVPGHCDHCEA